MIPLNLKDGYFVELFPAGRIYRSFMRFFGLFARAQFEWQRKQGIRPLIHMGVEIPVVFI